LSDGVNENLNDNSFAISPYGNCRSFIIRESNLKPIPFLDILYTLTYIALTFGCLSLLFKGEIKPFLRLAGYGAVVLALELLIIAWLIYSWPFGKIIERYITHGLMLIPYLIKEYF